MNPWRESWSDRDGMLGEQLQGCCPVGGTGMTGRKRETDAFDGNTQILCDKVVEGMWEVDKEKGESEMTWVIEHIFVSFLKTVIVGEGARTQEW